LVIAVTTRRRRRLPEFIAEVVEDPGGRAALIGGSAALFAAGLDPRVWSASLRSVQAAVRLEPDIEAIIVLATVVEAGVLLAGGAIGDTFRSRPIILAGLVAELLTALAGLVVSDGPLFVAGRLIGLGAALLVIPAALASVATSYSGTARATAIGLAYGAYGAALAAGPIILELLPGEQWPAFVAATAACGLALAILVARPPLPALERPTRVERPYVLATAWWGMAIVLVTAGLLWFGSGWDNPLRWALILGGAGAFLGVIAYERRRRRLDPG
jgi:MFS family permease